MKVVRLLPEAMESVLKAGGPAVSPMSSQLACPEGHQTAQETHLLCGRRTLNEFCRTTLMSETVSATCRAKGRVMRSQGFRFSLPW